MRTTPTRLLSTVATAIYGITSVLDTYWQKQKTAFPYPSMVGAGDHNQTICWAVLGQAPNLAAGVPEKVEKDVLYHACQGMHLAGDASDLMRGAGRHPPCDARAPTAAQGGYGAQLDSGGSNCGHGAQGDGGGGQSCGVPTGPYSARATTNAAASAAVPVPISASQLSERKGAAPGRHHGAVRLRRIALTFRWTRPCRSRSVTASMTRPGDMAR